MQITGYGVTLVSLKQEQIEMVRQWRNADAIAKHMEYREHITAQMQQNWFDGLRPLNDWYFVIYYLNEPIGLIHASQIDWDTKTGDAGLFIADERYLGTHVSVLASLSMVDAVFHISDLQQLRAKVMLNNSVAAHYNQKLGFQLQPNQQGQPFQQYLLTKENYTTASEPLRKIARSIGKAQLKVQVPAQLYQALKAQQLLAPPSNLVQLEVEDPSITL